METLARYGPYRILEYLGAGRPGDRFLAATPEPSGGERLVVVELLPPTLSEEAERREALLEGAIAATRLNHVNVLHTFDVGSHEDEIYVVTEFADGLDLVDLLARRPAGAPLKPAVGAFLVGEVCAALSYAHNRRDEKGQLLDIVHGDIRPARLTVTYQGQAKVAGFPLHGLRPPSEDVASELAFDPRYAAPELLRGEDCDARADIFAAGAVFFELLTGRMARDLPSDCTFSEAADHAPPTSLRELEAGIPEALEEIAVRALAPHPEERYQTANELRSALTGWVRRHAVGFGRHRIEAVIDEVDPRRELGKLPSKEWRPLHRKDFRPGDPSSQAHTVSDAETGRVGDRPSLRSLIPSPEPEQPDGPADDVVQPPASGRLVGGAAAGTPESTDTPDDEGLEHDESAPEVFASRSFLDAETDESAPEAAPTASRPERRARKTPAASTPAAPTPDELAGNVYDDAATTSAPDAELSELYGRVSRTEEPRRRARTVRAMSWLVVLGLIAGGGWFAIEWAVDRAAASAETAELAPASVFVTSRPHGAEIIVDGQPTGLTTPAVVTEVQSSDEPAIGVRLDGFESTAPQTISVEPGTQADVRFDLTPIAHTVRVNSEPAGAVVIHEGREVGRTPTSIGPVRVDHRQGIELRLELEGYMPAPVHARWPAGSRESSILETLAPDPNHEVDPVQ